MAAGAVVTIRDSWTTGGNRTEYIGTIALGSSHLAAGDVLTAPSGVERFAHLSAVGGGTSTTGGGFVFQFNAATQTLYTYQQKDPANAGGADIPLTAVANGDLSAHTAVPFRALSD